MNINNIISFFILVIVPILIVLSAKGKDKNAYFYGVVIALYQTIFEFWGGNLNDLNWWKITVMFFGLALSASFTFAIVNKINPRFLLIYFILWHIFYYFMYAIVHYFLGIMF